MISILATLSYRNILIINFKSFIIFYYVTYLTINYFIQSWKCRFNHLEKEMLQMKKLWLHLCKETIEKQ